jgi:F0F1-type ATP synthase membrane subunit c/vacuolar-type H+-ATPase subunit K
MSKYTSEPRRVTRRVREASHPNCKQISAFAIGLALPLAALTACAGPASVGADGVEYTYRTEKMSRAPRDKFYRIVKVPVKPKVAAPSPAAKTDQMPCGAAEKKPS